MPCNIIYRFKNNPIGAALQKAAQTQRGRLLRNRKARQAQAENGRHKGHAFKSVAVGRADGKNAVAFFN